MDNKEELFDKIEDYLRGKLTEEESRAFEQQIAADSGLAEQVELQRFEQLSLEFLLEEELKQKMEAWKKEGPPSGTPPKGGPSRSGLWLGLLTVAIVASFFFFRKGPVQPAEETPRIEEQQVFPSSAPSTGSEKPAAPSGPVAEKAKPESIPKQRPAKPEPENQFLAVVDAFYTPPANFTETGLRGESGQGGQSVLEQGIQAFTTGDYKKAIRLLHTIRPGEGEEAYETAQECLAHAFLKDKQFNKAASIFQSILEKGYLASINDQAEWYLVLSLLPDYAARRQRINQLVDKMTGDPYHSYHEKAVELKARLDVLRD